MVDTMRLKEQVDCRAMIQADLGEPPRRGSRAWNWRCPFHHERKGYSLAVWAEGWRCFGACQVSGDAIAWLQRYHGLDFRAAYRALGGEKTLSSSRLRTHQTRARANAASSAAISEPPSMEWQVSAMKVVEQAEATLWSKDGERALAYLQEKRGLMKYIIREAQLGYIPGHYQQWRNLYGLTVPCGITLPWLADGSLWAIKVRRAAGSMRYEQVGGANLAGSLYWADNLLPGWPTLLVEGEFNCLTAWQEAMDLVCPVSLGSASNTLNPRWYAALATSPRILACFDRDEAGEKAIERIRALTPRAQSVLVPEGKDINEYQVLNRGEVHAVRHWLESLAWL